MRTFLHHASIRQYHMAQQQALHEIDAFTPKLLETAQAWMQASDADRIAKVRGGVVRSDSTHTV